MPNFKKNLECYLALTLDLTKLSCSRGIRYELPRGLQGILWGQSYEQNWALWRLNGKPCRCIGLPKIRFLTEGGLGMAHFFEPPHLLPHL